MVSKKGDKVIHYEEDHYECDIKDGEQWDDLMERIKKETQEERKEMDIGDTIEFEDEDVSVRKTGEDQFALEIEGSAMQSTIQRVEKFFGSLIRRK